MHELDCPRCGRRPLDEFVVRRRAPDDAVADRRTPTTRDFDEVWIFDNPDGIDDRALVPRRRLPALADGPPRHVGRPGRRGRDDVDGYAGAAARDPRPRPGPVRCRRRRGAAGGRRASLGGSAAFVVTDPGVVALGRRRSRRRPARAPPGIEVELFDGVEPNPGTASIERGSERLRAFARGRRWRQHGRRRRSAAARRWTPRR